MSNRVPLALRQLGYQRGGTLASAAGVAFAVLLMALQFSIRESLYDSSVLLHRAIRGDIVLLSSQFASLSNMPRFPRRELDRAKAVTGVASADALYADVVPWRNPQTGVPRLIYIFGFDPDRRLLDLEGVDPATERMRLPNVVLFDRLSRPEFGPIAQLATGGRSVRALISVDQKDFDPEVEVGGLFRMGPGFIVDGNLVTSDLNFNRITNVSLGLVTIGVVRVQPGVDPSAEVSRLAAVLPTTVKVLTVPEFIAMERQFWARHTAIGFVFNFGLAMGFLIGVGFLYQVLHTMIGENLPEYAILKTMGYSDWRLISIVLELALMIALLGFAGGEAGAILLAGLARNATHLSIQVNAASLLWVFGATLAMCLAGGLLASRRLRAADPVEIFF
jgi:putative ABC transport system permease protein